MQHETRPADPMPKTSVERKKPVRKLKFFNGSGFKDGAQVMVCVMATSVAQCAELCDLAGLRGVNKGNIQSHWNASASPTAQMAQVLPVTEASVWAIEQHSMTMPTRLYPTKHARVAERLTRENLPANWPFPIAIFSKEPS